MSSRAKSVEQLENLILTYKSCVDEKKKKILHINIIEIAMQLVKKIAIPLSTQSNIPTEDLIQVGSIGLIKAIEFYDIERKAKFKTYASYFIRGEIKHYLRDKASFIKAPREIQELVTKISSTIKVLKEEGIEEPTEEQLSEALGVATSKIHNVMELALYKSIISLDQSISSTEEDDLFLIDKIPAEDYQENVISYENKMMLDSAIKKLPYEQRKVIELSYYHDLNQREISKQLNLSQMQVSRRLKKALSRMYQIIRKEEDI